MYVPETLGKRRAGQMLLDKLDEIENKYDELTKILSDPEIFSDYSKSQKYSKEQSDLEDVVHKIKNTSDRRGRGNERACRG
jgi:protein subunit release factor A